VAATRITTQDIKDAAVTGAKLGVLSVKGDILVFGTAHTRLAVGADGTVLAADSTQATGLAFVSAVTSGNVILSEVPSGTVNGVNAAFTLANTPVAGTVQLYKNGVRQQVGGANDYTIATNTITFVAGNLPQTGDILLADYRK
jgi:hypothetical protein